MIAILLALPLGAQALAMLVDELHFHRRRRLPRWERIGHPLDTATVLACFAVAIALPPRAPAMYVYGALATFSCLFVTKDEAVHLKHCSAGEQWLHSVLFTLHPIVLASVALLWWRGLRAVLVVQAALTLAFGVYQIVYWNLPRRISWRRRTRSMSAE